MSLPVALSERRKLPLHRRLVPLLAVGIARLLAKAKPARLRTVLNSSAAAHPRPPRPGPRRPRRRRLRQPALRRPGLPATLHRHRPPLPRPRLLAHLVHRHPHPPFAAHAWVEAHNQPIGEPHPKGHYKPLIVIPAVGAGSGGCEDPAAA